MDTYGRGDLTFDVLDEGPPSGAVVVLLHGFPQQNTSWNREQHFRHARGQRPPRGRRTVRARHEYQPVVLDP
jgi:pimeloyl-ACP methyl ester carboxylesterase